MSTPTPEERAQAQRILGHMLSTSGMGADEADELAEFAIEKAAHGETEV